jgi:hypothetical protein
VGWSLLRLVAEAAVGENKLRNFEKGLRRLSLEELGAIKLALESAGVVFSPNESMSSEADQQGSGEYLNYKDENGR